MLFTTPLPETIDVQGASVEYLRCGSGPAMLFLHGCDGISPDDPFLTPLASRFEVIAPSLPGFGASDLPKSMRSIQDVAGSVADFADALGLDRPILAGSSFGGWVALELASRWPERYRSLILTDALGVKFSEDPLNPGIRDIFLVETRDHPNLWFADKALGRTVFRDMDMTQMEDAEVLRYCRNREALTLFGWAPLLHNPALRNQLRRVALPTLVLWGAEDEVVSPDLGRQLADALPHARFQLIEGAGHYLPIEKPGLFAEAVTAFTEDMGVQPA